MNRVTDVIVRATVVLISAFAVWKSAQLARADLAWSDGTTAGLHRAVEILPHSADMAARLVLRRVDDGEDGPDLDHALSAASQLNPLNAELLMVRALRLEQAGDQARAHQLLIEAAKVDHQFKPAWTLANFSLRSGLMEEFWPMIRRCLELEPFGFEPNAVFDLAWRVASDAKQIQVLIPSRSPKTLRYLSYLSASGRTEAAIALWPAALESIDRSLKGDVALAQEFPGFLVNKGQVPAALRAWNQLVDRSVLRSGRIEPANGTLLADPEFSFDRNAGVFSWQVPDANGVFPAPDYSALRFELDGNQNQSLVLAQTTALVLPGRKHKLSWKADGTRLNLASDAGFALQVLGTDGRALVECPALLDNHGAGSCLYTAKAQDQTVRVALNYTRAQGTTRAAGTLELSSVKLEALQ